MAIVSDIRETRGIVEIVADGATVARVRRAHFSKCPVENGGEIDVEDYLGRVASVQFADAYEAALSSLDYCARSARELGNALRRKGYVQPAIEAVVARLTESGLIDDARYAQRMAETQVNKPVGLYALKRKLRAKGIVDAVDGEWIYFDYVPGEIDVRRGSPAVTGRFCVIGSKMNEDALKELFQI